ncbi:protein phosphatase 2C 50 [Daucus carota subsp. sativus]|uniref:protein-serine/threonine phosphatase n=2 Tax=Daucus carota subsp. sativus TaxID=79200 RepID=A0A162AM91_DAUCS|nr:PREDICTED: probable protein phosphatase 2C 50 [Daucus carota subsp. sativus]XP_017243152.1 PREDICTED: probable protein phosphatase 2C 50 [Daucus carota subsp. sativus]XP_017243153.1 PREDICTED: probable protein phosphatase 2C 50 [Daucus carota subsp. sativus]
MEDVSHEVAVPLRLSHIICEEFDLIASIASLFSEPKFIKLPFVAIASESICYNYNNHKTGICARAKSTREMKEEDTLLNVMKAEMHSANILTSSNTIKKENSYSQSLVSLTDGICTEQYEDLRTNTKTDELITSDIRKSIGSPQISEKPDFLDSDNSSEIVVDLVVAVNEDVELGGPKKRPSTVNLEGVKEKKMNTSLEDLVVAVSSVDVEIDGLNQKSEIGGLNQKKATVLLDGIKVEKNMSTGDTAVTVNNVDMESDGSKQILSTTHPSNVQKNTKKSIGKPKLFNFVPNWGLTSLQGGRSEMEDAVVAIPNFLEIPTPVLTLISNELNQTLSHSTAHFFGVYDGHGGSQVADYCRDRIHLALAEEFELVKEHLHIESVANNWQEQLENAFLRCFRRVDMEVAGVDPGNANGEERNLEPIASDAVGSTAVVTLICSTHIMVANCGDSRAVLCRGKESLALSLDHKPGRHDERKRIEAAGGMVIYWDELRVSGVLAMSRSIGDRYLAPYVISDPEMMFVPRTKEDECLILATDGLWDVVKNEEACDLARKRIHLWHKRNGSMLTSSGEVSGSAAQDAASFLSQLALQRGSKDNISVIVVDLKAQRKFKKKTEPANE